MSVTKSRTHPPEGVDVQAPLPQHLALAAVVVSLAGHVVFGRRDV
jgi:multisubunit Na+/H+ antiporter MnhC subunit